mmetsp:Transcript_13114/g.52304  ORF Transcript_13114/g.52304 Transcript_13114/m.52304 type:complete len:689 (+) Transcript_13114:22-2088(+)
MSLSPMVSAANGSRLGGKANLTAIHWSVTCYTKEKEQVFVTGSCDELGNWDPNAAVALSTSSKQFPVWKVDVQLPTGQLIEYKYFVRGPTAGADAGEKHDGGSAADSTEVAWEASRNRRITPKGYEVFVDDGHFCSPNAEDQLLQEERYSQWLGDKHQLYITLGRPLLHGRESPFSNMDARKVKRLVISYARPVVPAQDRGRGEEQGCLAAAVDQDQRHEIDFPLQKPNQDYIFRASSLEAFALVFEVYGGSEGHTLLGRAYVTPAMLSGDHEIMQQAIVDHRTHCVIGELAFQYLVITPFSHPSLTNITTRTYWKSTEYVYMGHRGMGANHAKSKSGKKTAINENTILAFVTAATKGTNYVEFDVQLTKDGVPVIYHNFVIDIVGENGEKYNLPVSALTLEEFKALRKPKECDMRTKKKSRHKKRGSMSDVEQLVADSMKEQQKLAKKAKAAPVVEAVAANGGKEAEEDGHAQASTDSGRDTGSAHTTITDQELPTLDDVFRLVPPSLGFDIEVKYPHDHQKDGLPALPDRNEIVDAILDVVFTYAHVDRQIFFSSFDPPTCQMLALKQPRYPVFFLTTAGYESCPSDPRCNSIYEAVRFAKAANLMGIVSYAKPLVLAPSLIRTIKQAGLLVVSYGSENNEIENIELQEEYGIDAIISDHQLNPRGLFPVIQHQSSSSLLGPMPSN